MKSYKKDQRGITHNLILAGIAVLVLGAIGFAGFKVYKSKNDISAKAASWLTIKTGYISGKSYSVRACKISNTSGKVYITNQTEVIVRLQDNGGNKVTANPSSNSSVTPSVIKNGTMSGAIADQYWRAIGSYQATSSQLNKYIC